MEENEQPGPRQGPPPPFPEADESRFAGARRLSEGAGRLIARGSTSAFLGARRFTRSGGAGESGLSRLLELHAFNTAGDAAVAVSLAGTLFFTVPTEQASSQVALFLVLTMLPFAVVAPLIGPFLDRFRHGRRWAIGTTLAVRAFCCWVRAAAVPRLLPVEFTLVKANSRISLTGTAAAVISAPLAVGAAAIGAPWALRYAAVLFVIGTILAILLPERVDSTAGEEQVDIAGRRHGIAVSRNVVNGLRSNAGLRLLTGFLTIFMAFVLREPPDSMGWGGNATVLMALVIGAAGLGNILGIVIGSWTKSRRPERVVLAVLVLDVVVLVLAAAFFKWPLAAVLGLTVGLCQSLGKLSLDALIQKDVDEHVRTSMFARSETLLQLSWVIGGLLGIGLFTLDVSAPLGMVITAVILLAWLSFVMARVINPPPTPSPIRP
jgi:MFS family permease